MVEVASSRAICAFKRSKPAMPSLIIGSDAPIFSAFSIASSKEGTSPAEIAFVKPSSADRIAAKLSALYRTGRGIEPETRSMTSSAVDLPSETNSPEHEQRYGRPSSAAATASFRSDLHCGDVETASAVLPYALAAPASTPCERSVLTVERWPDAAARCSGVFDSVSSALAERPFEEEAVDEPHVALVCGPVEGGAAALLGVGILELVLRRAVL